MDMKTARIAVSSALYSIDRPYEYKIPKGIQNRIRPGMRVIVPFGRGNRKCEGFVLKITDVSGNEKLKTIDCLLDDNPVLTESQIKLGLWMRDRFFCTVYDALRAMLPAGIWFKIELFYTMETGVTAQMAKETVSPWPDAIKVLDILEHYGGSVPLDTIKRIMGDDAATSALKRLRDLALVRQEAARNQNIRDKSSQMAYLSIPAGEAMELAFRKKKSAPHQSAVLTLMCSLGESDVKELCYFTGAPKATVKKLADKGYLELETYEVFRSPEVRERKVGGKLKLTEEQNRAFEGIMLLEGTGEASVTLLHGITGSGKTSIYVSIIENMLKRGKDSIFLVPEIALTPQLAGEFMARFGDNVAVLHSGLSIGERYDEWKRVKKGIAHVVVGTRSAVFAPVKDLGAIIIDEEQEYTYKSQISPRYHARDVAKYRCHQNGALLILGSATPDVESMSCARDGIYHYFSLKTRYNQMELPQVIIADMKKNLRNGNSSVISTELKEEIEKNLLTGEQSILFINRRGTSNLITCGECGYVHDCPRCSVSLTYHADNNRLMCHYCGFSQILAGECPECGGIMKHIGAGTQKVEKELSEIFPGVEVLRMDTDTISGKNPHEKILSRFEEEKIPILVGTQMITKGLDFENVTLVGIISADQALYTSDYRAQEKTFGQITQVVGRAGRGVKKGRAVIQTYTPRNEIIQLAARQDYDDFFEREIELRRVLECPPVRDLVYILATGINESSVLSCLSYIRRGLEVFLEEREDVTVLGPAPAVVTRINNKFRHKVTIKCKNDKMIRDAVSQIIRQASGKKEFRRIAVYGDLGSLD